MCLEPRRIEGEQETLTKGQNNNEQHNGASQKGSEGSG
jgi:hypothetical protein